MGWRGGGGDALAMGGEGKDQAAHGELAPRTRGKLDPTQGGGMGGEEVGEEEGRARKASSGPAWGGSGVGEVGSVRGPYSHRSRTLGRLQSRVRDIPPYPPVSR